MYKHIISVFLFSVLIVFLFPADLVYAATPIPVGQSGNWTLVFSDEFDGGSVDLTKWRPNWLGPTDTSLTPPVNAAEAACYDPAQVTVANGELNLTAVQRSCLGKNYASGMVESNGKFNFSYGYMEARIWTPAGTGMWPAFWSDGHTWPADGEIDVLEAYGTDVSTFHYHYAGCGGNCGPGGQVTVPGATTGWHTYAADWEPGVITWYYDGQQVWQYTTAIVSSPQFLILNLALKSAPAAVPDTLRVDYVRVWKPCTTNCGTPTPIPTPGVIPGDANGDGHVDETDYVIWLSHFGTTIPGGASVGDFNNDGKVDGIDYSIWLGHYGA